MFYAKRIIVRREFSQEAVWRKALGNSEPLLTHADRPDCLDAPDWILAGSVCSSRPYKEDVSRQYTRMSMINRDSI